MSRAVVNEEKDFPILPRKSRILGVQPFAEEGLGHPSFRVRLVSDGQSSDALETARIFLFSYHKELQLVAARHVCSNKNSQSVFAEFATCAQFTFKSD